MFRCLGKSRWIAIPPSLEITIFKVSHKRYSYCFAPPQVSSWSICKSFLEVYSSYRLPNVGQGFVLESLYIILSSSGEAWQDIMMDCSAKNGGVRCDKESDQPNALTCGSDIAFPYFISFYVLCSFLVSNILSDLYRLDSITIDWTRKDLSFKKKERFAKKKNCWCNQFFYLFVV